MLTGLAVGVLGLIEIANGSLMGLERRGEERIDCEGSSS